jgi:hypothetical protein
MKPMTYAKMPYQQPSQYHLPQDDPLSESYNFKPRQQQKQQSQQIEQSQQQQQQHQYEQIESFPETYSFKTGQQIEQPVKKAQHLTPSPPVDIMVEAYNSEVNQLQKLIAKYPLVLKALIIKIVREELLAEKWLLKELIRDILGDQYCESLRELLSMFTHREKPTPPFDDDLDFGTKAEMAAHNSLMEKLIKKKFNDVMLLQPGQDPVNYLVSIFQIMGFVNEKEIFKARIALDETKWKVRDLFGTSCIGFIPNIFFMFIQRQLDNLNKFTARSQEYSSNNCLKYVIIFLTTLLTLCVVFLTIVCVLFMALWLAKQMNLMNAII